MNLFLVMTSVAFPAYRIVTALPHVAVEAQLEKVQLRTSTCGQSQGGWEGQQPAVHTACHCAKCGQTFCPE